MSLPLTASYRNSTPGLCDRSFLMSADRCSAEETSYLGGSKPSPSCNGARLRLLSGCAKDPMPSKVLYRPLPDRVTGSEICAASSRRPAQQPTRIITALTTPWMRSYGFAASMTALQSGKRRKPVLCEYSEDEKAYQKAAENKIVSTHMRALGRPYTRSP
jgi:hypothetical protein